MATTKYKEVISATEGRLLLSSNKPTKADGEARDYFQCRPQATHSVTVRASNVAFPDTFKQRGPPNTPIARIKDESLSYPSRTSKDQGPPQSQKQWSHLSSGSSSAQGESIAISIELAQPTLYVEGYDLQHSTAHNSTVLRGFVKLQVFRTVTLRRLSLELSGITQTLWPESWRLRHLKKVYDEKFFSHKWDFLDESTSGLKSTVHAGDIQVDPLSVDSPDLDLPPAFSSLAIPSNNIDAAHDAGTFKAGVYTFNFELPLESSLPETIRLPLGSVSYMLTTTAAEAARHPIYATSSRPLQVVRAPCACSLEWTEPLLVHGSQHGLHYKFVLHGQSFPVGSRAPLSILILPELDRNWHRITVSLVEDVQYRTRDGLAQREQSHRNALLLDKRPDDSDNDDSSTLSLQRSISTVGEAIACSLAGATYVEKSEPWQGSRKRSEEGYDLNEEGIVDEKVILKLPTCSFIHADTAYSCIYVRHWLVVSLHPYLVLSDKYSLVPADQYQCICTVAAKPKTTFRDPDQHANPDSDMQIG